MSQDTVKETAVVAKTKKVEIRYHAEPRRYYEVRGYGCPKDGIVENWVECDFSMSGVADCLSKEGLTWWGMGIGLMAIPKLIESGYIRVAQTADGQYTNQIIAMGESQWEIVSFENLMALVKKYKLTVNHVRDKAGDRGNSVHSALENWVESGAMPVPDFFPVEEQGYVRGLVSFLSDLGELKTKPLAEVMVGSVEHRIAGRYDLEAVLHGSNLVTKKATPSWTGGPDDHHSAKPPVYKEYTGRTLFDLKTSKAAYFGHKLQMTGYEGCRIECGMPKTEQQLIVVVGDDGRYQVTEADTTWDEFLTVLAVARITKERG